MQPCPGQVADAEGAGMRVDGLSGNGHPSPNPLRSSFDWRNASNIFCSSPLRRPPDWSSISTRPGRARTVTLPPLRVNFTAFRMRFNEVPERGPQDASIPVDPDRHLVERQGDSARLRVLHRVLDTALEQRAQIASVF